MARGRPRGGKKYHQGTYHVVNTSKYVGKNGIAVWRSSWEHSAFMCLDKSQKVLKWGSENVTIPYSDPTRGGSIHQYVMDLFIQYIDVRTDKTVTMLAEIKPYSQTIMPVKGRKSRQTYMYQILDFARNQAKWLASKAYCEKKSWKFVIWTEKGSNLFS